MKCLQQRVDWADLLHLHWIKDQSHLGRDIWEQALRHLPEERLPFLNYGNILRDLNQFEAADEAYSKARIYGDRHERIAVAWNHSQLLIGLECYSRAYALAEERLLQTGQPFWRPGPYWQGWPLQAVDAPRPSGLSGSVTVWTEQGIGDSLQYVRWILPLIQQGYSVRLEVDPPLLPLFREGLAWLGEPLQIVAKGIAPTPLSNPCQGSLLSLPALLGGAPLVSAFSASAPRAPSPLGYLRSARWQPPSPHRPRPRIGLVWASGRKVDHPFLLREYERRSLPAPSLWGLLEGLAAQEVDLVALQFGSDRQRADGWNGAFAASLSDDLSLAETAAWLTELDLVLTVDTATAHLAGAMALPCWVLLPWAADPRWLRDRADSPWYPTLTLWRQPEPGDWSGLVAALLEGFGVWRRSWTPSEVGPEREPPEARANTKADARD